MFISTPPSPEVENFSNENLLSSWGSNPGPAEPEAYRGYHLSQREHSNKGIHIIKELLDASLLSLNISKTALIQFSLTIHGLEKSDIKRNVTINNCNLNSCACPAFNCSTQVKYLGIIDDNF